jgi:osmotically inducible protein OsmC
MAAERRAQTTWEGDLASGSGTLTGASGAIGPQAVSWAARTEEPGGNTSPEELLAAAHSSCFSMALSGALARAGTPPRRLETEAVVTFDKLEGGWKITRSALSVRGDVPGADEQTFREAAEDARDNCPVSQALIGNVELSVHAELAGT